MKRNREKTHTRIRLAIVPIEKGRPKIISSTRRISIAAVAEEAEVSTTLIHNQYPDLKARIQGNQNKEVQSQRNDIRLKYQIEKQKKPRVSSSD
jgi:ribosomal protein L18